ncbi:UDP-glucuronic acid decarboxylase family protein [Cytobacillus firmus]|uniref:UDP-glucuronic acid decarboxylase family protein n=1 Tax=Cytobacillus firmus TaxID=1399 RepID=UPI001C8D67BB|nr:UDP-glucuronic acid decarboxylase family protein [Cytobacillus firmus]MBX9974038.1 SDR family oxidoreductase [Cytobacillus firmus]
MKAKKVLVTGGSGFLGSHLCRFLLNEGHEVFCIDNLYTGRKENIEDLTGNERFTFILHDIVQPIDIEADEIYHLACPASPPHYQLDPVKTLTTNFIGSLNLLELAKKYNSKILFASTSEVYGDPLIHPQKESYNGNVNSIGPRACYDEGKRCAESLFFEYYRQHHLNIRVIRIFNTYGPGMALNDGRVVSNFILQALKGKDLTVYGDGSQTRSFCFVDDLISGMVSMMNTKKDFTGPVNLGNPAEVTVLELANKIIDLIGSSSKITFLPIPKDDPSRRKPDISLAKEQLNWMPAVTLDEGLKKTIEYFKSETK